MRKQENGSKREVLVTKIRRNNLYFTDEFTQKKEKKMIFEWIED